MHTVRIEREREREIVVDDEGDAGFAAQRGKRAPLRAPQIRAPVLLRYCTNEAPPRSACTTLPTRISVRGSSGVMA
jgi:hypothetical protein